MPRRPTSLGSSFVKTRRDHASETAEDYVEAIAQTIADKGHCRGVDLVKRFGVSHVTVTRTVARLQTQGWVQTEPFGPVTLTPAGKRLAQDSSKRHQIVLDFLRALGVSANQAEVDSEGIEHHVSQETLQAFQRFLKRTE